MSIITDRLDRPAFIDAALAGKVANGQRAIVSFVNHLNVADFYSGTLRFTQSADDAVILDLDPGQIFFGENSIEVFSTMYNNFLPHNLLHVSFTDENND